jgi:hypothetical protein
MGQGIRSHGRQEHHDEIRSSVPDPRAVSRWADLAALLDDAVDLA